MSTGLLKTHPNFVSMATRELFSKAFTFPVTMTNRNLNQLLNLFRTHCPLYRQISIQQIQVGFEHDSEVAFSKAKQISGKHKADIS